MTRAFSHGGIVDLGLKGKLALVTASTDGIGYAIAKLLVQENAHVIINGRSEKSVNQAIAQLKQENSQSKLLPAPFDLSKQEGVEALIKAYPQVDILINNLGIYEIKKFEDISDEDWLRFFEVNVLSGVRLSRYYFPLMISKNWGRIVFISSESALNTPGDMIHYGMTKTAQLAVGRGLAELTKGTQVTVNSVLPGPTYSTGVQTFITEIAKKKGITPKEAEKEFFKTTRPTSLLQRFSTTDEVAALVVFVCSEKASSTNGAALRVEGGIVHTIA